MFGGVEVPGDLNNTRLYAWIGKKPDLCDAVLGGLSMPLSVEQGFAGVAPVAGLEADTKYHYTLTLDDRLPHPSAGLITEGLYPAFQTFPEPGTPVSFNFVFGSCFRPQDKNGGRIFNKLEKRRQTENLRFMILLGDQIYSDDYPTNSIKKIAVSLDEYREVYSYVWSWPPLRRLFLTMPAFMTLDDHEVDDDWCWKDHNRTEPQIPIWDRIHRIFRPQNERNITLEKVKAALQAYWEHQGMHAPCLIELPALDGFGGYSLADNDPGSLAYTFEFGPAAFFVMDTCTMRTKPHKREHRIMLGENQWVQLKEWLLQVKYSHAVKFLVSSGSLLFSSWLDFPEDRWAGFTQERDRLLHFLAENSIRDVYVLSGDFHFGFAIRAELYGSGGRGLPLWEFCSSPFEQGISEYAAKTRRPIRNGLFKSQECRFVYTAPNFGLVRVKMDEGGAPKVGFELYDERGKAVHQAGDEIE